MVIVPKVWHSICTTAHPDGCALNIQDQVIATCSQGRRHNGPKRVLIVGASTGYGMAARITAAFGFGAATLGVFHDKKDRPDRVGSAGWYNTAAFHKLAEQTGLWACSINGDAFSHQTRALTIQRIREGMRGPIDLFIYSLAAPARRLPDTGEIIHSTLKPIGAPYSGKTIDTDQDRLADILIEPATPQEIRDTIRVMGGEDWALWTQALIEANALSKGASTVAFSYIGSEMTWPVYGHGTIGRAKNHLDETAVMLRARFQSHGLGVHVAILQASVTQASAAIPVMPLYASLLLRVMKAQGLHENTIEQQNRLFREFLYRSDSLSPVTDTRGRFRLDDRELCNDVQQGVKALASTVEDGNLFEVTDYLQFKREFLQLFGFARPDLDYEVDTDIHRPFGCIEL